MVGEAPHGRWSKAAVANLSDLAYYQWSVDHRLVTTGLRGSPHFHFHGWFGTYVSGLDLV